MVTSFTKQIALLEFETYGAALAVTNRLGQESSLHIFEVIARGQSASVLLGSSADSDLRSTLSSLGAAQLDLMNEPHPDLLATYLNQKTSKALDILICAESSHIGSLLSFANAALANGFVPIEFRFSRAGLGAGHVLLTAGQSRTHVAQSLDGRYGCKVQVIQELSKPVQSLFDFLV